MAHDPHMCPHRIQPLHALLLGVHRPAGVREGPAPGARVWLVVGEAEVPEETADWGRRAVERRREHYEGRLDEVQAV